MIVDAHSHLFSRPFFEALASASPLPGTVEEKLDRVASRAKLDLPPRDLGEHVERWLGELDANGVAHLVTFASAPQEVPAVAEAVSLAGGRMTAFAVVDPTADGAADATEALLGERGFRGVLLFPAMHRYDPRGPECRAVVEVVARHRAVAVVHCGILQVRLRDLLGLPRPYDLAFADPVLLVPLANAFPAAHLVIPHFGAGYFREALMTASMCPNVLLDTSSSNAWMATQPGRLRLADVFERALEVVGPERVLFGTDSSVFPRGWRRDVLLAQREALGACGASDEDVARVLGGNAVRILGLR